MRKPSLFLSINRLMQNKKGVEKIEKEIKI